MAQIRYFYSQSPHTPSPSVEKLLCIEADSSESAIKLISDKGEAPPEWPTVWAHLLLRNDDKQCVFESMRLR